MFDSGAYCSACIKSRRRASEFSLRGFGGEIVSLIEQTIARLKKGAATVDKEATNEMAAPKMVAPPYAELDASAKIRQRLTLDLAALRAAGYLPEESMDRQFAEYYRQIKRPLIDKAFAANGVPSSLNRRLIMVTSALPGDGKTFTTINLALSMARERDMSVLLVDADGLKRHLSEILGLEQEPGLLDALVDETANAESLVVPTSVRGLAILPAGRPVEGIAELFSGNRLRQILDGLMNQNPRRVVLLDSPPLLLTNEGRALTKIAGQLALVVRAGKTPQQAVRDAIGMLDEQQAGGIILNQGHAGFTEGYYGYSAYGTETNETVPKR